MIMVDSEYYFYPQKSYASAMYSCTNCMSIEAIHAECCDSAKMLSCANFWIGVKINTERLHVINKIFRLGGRG